MNREKHHFFKFKRKKIKYQDEDPIQDLIDLYAEEEKELNENNASVAEQNCKSNPKIKDEHYLKKLIEEKRHQRRKRIFILSASALFILAASALAGFFYFNNFQPLNTDDASIAIEAPEKIQLGEEFNYTINYQNLGNIDFTNSRVIVQYPKGFILLKTDPAISDHKWTLGTLAAGQSGKILITGKIIDLPDSEQKLIANLTFEPSNFHSEFTKESSFSFGLELPKIEFVNDFPANLTPGQKITLQTKLKNSGSNQFDNIKLQYSYPNKFKFLNASPAAYEDSNQWLIVELKEKSESKIITIEGSFPTDLTFANETERDQAFALQLLFPGKDGQYFPINEAKFSVKIIDQALNTYLIANGSTENKTIALGDELAITAIAKNSGPNAYQNIKMKLLFAGPTADIINWNKLKDEHYGKIQKIDNTKEIIWDAKQISALKSLAGGKDVSVSIVVPLKSASELVGLDLNSLNQYSLEISSQIILDEKTNAGEPAVKSSPVILSLSSNLDIGAKALYYYTDGTPLGTGPWPPRVGQSTKLKIFWDLSNDLHELKDIEATTILPVNINWVNEKNASTGDLTFDETTRTVSWKINRLPSAVKEAHANFSLAFTPQQSEINTLIKLTGNTILNAHDLATGELITKTKNILTAALELDSFATGNGTVQP